MRIVTEVFIICCFNFVWCHDERWNLWKKTYKVTFSCAEEEADRKSIFCQNCDAIDHWNERYQRGEVNFSQGENKYTHLSAGEMEKLKGLFLPRQKIEDNLRQCHHIRPLFVMKKDKKILRTQRYRLGATNTDACTLDLRKDICLTPVKDQGVCGSEQQCVDCTRRYGNVGCDGGFYEACFQHWQTNRVRSSNAYPYTGQDQACQEPRTTGITTVAGYTTLTAFDEDQMLRTMCATRQPIAISIDATDLMNNYKSGVFDDPNCSNYLTTKSSNVNHAVSIVGAGVEPDGTKYWIVRNSWGTSWGEGGYIRMRRGINQCNLALNPVMLTIQA